MIWRRGDATLAKVLIVQAWDPNLDSQHLYKRRDDLHMSVAPVLSVETGRFGGVHVQ